MGFSSNKAARWLTAVLRNTTGYFEGLLGVFPGVLFFSGDQNWATFHWKTISICACGEEISSFRTNRVLSIFNRGVFVHKPKLSMTTALRKIQPKPTFLDVKTKIGTQAQLHFRKDQVNIKQ